MFHPVLVALGMSINEYMKPDSSGQAVVARLHNEWWKVWAWRVLSCVQRSVFGGGPGVN